MENISKENLVRVRIAPSLSGHPLKELHQAVSGFPALAAPERASQQVNEWDGIEIQILDAPNSRRAWAKGTTITLESGLLDALWCCAASHYISRSLYDEKTASQDLTKQHLEFDVEDPRVRDCQAWLALGLGNGPIDHNAVPSLDEAANRGTRQLASFATSFILYHELGHIRQNHTALPANPTPAQFAESREQEQDADGYALNWLLGILPVDDHVAAAFRAWGIFVATFLLSQREHENSSSVEAHVLPPRKTDYRTHPFAYLRLDRLMKQSAVTARPIVRSTLHSIAAVSIYIHGVHTRLSEGLKNRRFHDWEQLYEFLVDGMAKLAHGTHD